MGVGWGCRILLSDKKSDKSCEGGEENRVIDKRRGAASRFDPVDVFTDPGES